MRDLINLLSLTIDIIESKKHLIVWMFPNEVCLLAGKAVVRLGEPASEFSLGFIFRCAWILSPYSEDTYREMLRQLALSVDVPDEDFLTWCDRTHTGLGVVISAMRALRTTLLDGLEQTEGETNGG